MLENKKISEMNKWIRNQTTKLKESNQTHKIKAFFFHRMAFIAFWGMMGISNSALAEEYKEIEIKDSGSISGKVFLEGQVPSPRVFHLVLYPFEYFCKKISDGKDNRLLSEFSVSGKGELQDTVIVVEGISKGKAFPTPEVVIQSTDCVFHPYVSVVKNHQTIKVINNDPVVHNIQVYQSEKGKIIFNSPLPVQSTESGALNFEPGMHISQWICGMHEYMQNWAYVVDNPYYAISQTDGSFQIDKIPPGRYTVTAWHARMKVARKEVTISGGTITPVHFEFHSNEVLYPEYEKQEKGRIQKRGKAENFIR
jgi:plastocyanin